MADLTLGGMPVILSDYLTDSVTTRTPRTWRERLIPVVRCYDFPVLLVGWTPWRAETVTTRQVPSKTVLQMAGKLVMHPQTFRAIQFANAVRRIS